MVRVRGLLTATMVLALGAAMVTAAGAQVAGGGGGLGPPTIRGKTLLGLLHFGTVQTELKLSEECIEKIEQIAGKNNAERGKLRLALLKIENRPERYDKLYEAECVLDRMARKALREVLTQEQKMRLFQIYMQARRVLEVLSERYVASKLKLTDAQKAKLAEVGKQSYAKQKELFVFIGGADQGQRSQAKGEMDQIHAEADQKALKLLTTEQKKSLVNMMGEKFEL